MSRASRALLASALRRRALQRDRGLRLAPGLVLVLGLIASASTQAQTRPLTPSPMQAPTQAPTQGDAESQAIDAWLLRVHEAARHQNFVGTFVVSSGTGLSSARIWHACDGQQQLERIDSLTGEPRTTFRQDEQVVTFYPHSRVAVIEDRAAFGLFPHGAQAVPGTASLGALYRLRRVGSARMVGLESEVVELLPKDTARYGYRIWSERQSGLVVQLQTVAADGQVLEQAAFSELQLGARLSLEQLRARMHATHGYQLRRPSVQAVSALEEGWILRAPVAGFAPQGCFSRSLAPPAADGKAADTTLQWLFSDGLATVSLFITRFDPERAARPGVLALGGATHSVARRLDDWWVTAVGEVPPDTLVAFTQALARAP